MANTFDLQEQEQLDQLKHFWKRHGGWITAVLTLVLLGFAAFNGWQYWQSRQSAQAAALYDTLSQAVRAKETARIQTAWSDLQQRYGRTAIAQQGALLAAQGLADAGQDDGARAALQWLADQGSKPLQSVARLRLAALELQRQQWEAARQWLGSGIEPEFAALAADRLGDAYQLQGDLAQAKEAYLKAYRLMDETIDYRRLVVVKLNALGVDPEAPSAR